MIPLTREWVKKAEGDYDVVLRLVVRARTRPNYDAGAFHAQQCAEKYLKARLQEAAVTFPKTHDLVKLLDPVVAVEPAWAPYRPRLDKLSKAAVDVRYPGTSTTKTSALEAAATAREIRTLARRALGLRDPRRPAPRRKRRRP